MKDERPSEPGRVAPETGPTRPGSDGGTSVRLRLYEKEIVMRSVVAVAVLLVTCHLASVTRGEQTSAERASRATGPSEPRIAAVPQVRIPLRIIEIPWAQLPSLGFALPGPGEWWKAVAVVKPDLRQRLETLITEGKARTLSDPTVLTLADREATFIAGGDFSAVCVKGEEIDVPEHSSAGLTIRFLPTLKENNVIRLTVTTELSQFEPLPGPPGTMLRDSRQIKATFDLQPGQTLFIGSLLPHPLMRPVAGKPAKGRTEECDLAILVSAEKVDAE